ncbi:MAG: metal-sulfur cluster assembly factor [Verrucomicrobiota bacterium]
MIPESQLWQALHEIIDPEIGCNIVDLGLVYDISLAGDSVTVRMTLSTPGCPMGESLAHGVQQAMLAQPGIARADVELVWDPPWHPSMMTPQGRAALNHFQN